MNHIVNFGLLFSFITLAASGILSFLRPFSTVTARIHIVFGLATLLLVGAHLFGRIGYFKRTLAPRKKQSIGPLRLLGIAGIWLLLLLVSFRGWNPAQNLIELSYEAQQRANIVRSSPLTGLELTRSEVTLSRVPGEESDVSVSLTIQFSEDTPTPPAIAAWAETSSGSMIETLYLNEALSYSDTPEWNGVATPRNQILPIWRHRYTLVSGIDPKGEVDAVSGATKSHRFTLDNYLVTGEDKSFVLCVEVNQAADPNEHFPDPHRGQPSLLYTAYIEPDQKQKWVLLELTGHGGGAEDNGAIQYDLETCTTARSILDLLLARVEYHLATGSAP